MKQINHFIHQLSFDDLPEPVVQQAQICLLDLLGVAVAGHETRLAKIMLEFVQSQYPGDVPLLFSPHTASASGAALFGAMLIDSIDAHDGQVLTKGHVGVAILPGLLALLKEKPIDGKAFLTALVIGYEIATRAGIALHKTAEDYHTSGAWNSIGVAAVTARLHQLDGTQTKEALGTAEFYGPRSQMMRCIDYPTMVKDGSGWGALAGISAGLMAKAGFTGAPAITLVSDEVSEIWADLGQRWYILEQYFKAYPVCRWAQPAVEAVRQIRQQHPLNPQDIAEIHIHSFHEATRLHVKQPDTTEQAQYSLPFSVATAVMDDVISASSVAENDQGLFNTTRRDLSNKVITHEEDHYNAVFPAERWAHARIVLNDGTTLTSEPCTARGNPENPLTEQELIEKFHGLAANGLNQQQRDALVEQCFAIKEFGVEEVVRFIEEISIEV